MERGGEGGVEGEVKGGGDAATIDELLVSFKCLVNSLLLTLVLCPIWIKVGPKLKFPDFFILPKTDFQLRKTPCRGSVSYDIHLSKTAVLEQLISNISLLEMI